MSSPGAVVDEALTLAHRGAGLLSFMIIKKRLKRNQLEEAAGNLEESARLIRSALRHQDPDI